MFRLSILLCLFATPLLAQPRIVFDEARHDYGLTDQYTTVNHAFHFRNEGTEVLRISKVKST